LFLKCARHFPFCGKAKMSIDCYLCDLTFTEIVVNNNESVEREREREKER
jgi:hypothetical protein